jgi:hypothetical protein
MFHKDSNLKQKLNDNASRPEESRTAFSACSINFWDFLFSFFSCDASDISEERKRRFSA